MHFALVQPSIEDFYSTPHRVAGLAIKALEAIVTRHGHSSKSFLFMKNRATSIAIPSQLSYLKPYILPYEKGETTFFRHYYRFDPSTQEMANQILQNKPTVVLISCFAYAYTNSAKDLCQTLKKLSPSTKVVLGGAGVTVNPNYFANSLADTILLGEAEDSLNLYLSNLNLKGEIIANNAGNLVPLPLLSTSIINNYSFSFLRGCNYKCKFCSQHLTHGHNFRKADSGLIFKTLEQMTISPSSKIHFNFEDDNLLQAKELWFSIIDYLKQKYAYATFSAENGLNYSHLDENTLEQLINYGFTKFNLSLAVLPNGSKKQQRFVELTKLEQVLKQINSHGIEAIVYFIAGLNHTTPNDTMTTLLYLMSQPATIGISPFYAVPGLAGYEVENLTTNNPIFFRSSSFYPWSKSHTSQDLITAFRLSRTANFLKNSGSNNKLKEAILHQKKLLSLKKNKELFAIENLNQTMINSFFDGLNI